MVRQTAHVLGAHVDHRLDGDDEARLEGKVAVSP
jgi:hypothetical protein